MLRRAKHMIWKRLPRSRELVMEKFPLARHGRAGVTGRQWAVGSGHGEWAVRADSKWTCALVMAN